MTVITILIQESSVHSLVWGQRYRIHVLIYVEIWSRLSKLISPRYISHQGRERKTGDSRQEDNTGKIGIICVQKKESLCHDVRRRTRHTERHEMCVLTKILFQSFQVHENKSLGYSLSVFDKNSTVKLEPIQVDEVEFKLFFSTTIFMKTNLKFIRVRDQIDGSLFRTAPLIVK